MRLSRGWIIVLVIVAVIVVGWIGANGVLTTGSGA
jgi:hypothetical protein